MAKLGEAIPVIVGRERHPQQWRVNFGRGHGADRQRVDSDEEVILQDDGWAWLARAYAPGDEGDIATTKFSQGLLVPLNADSLDEILIVAMRICHGYSQGLTPCLIGKCRRANVRNPYLDRSKSLRTQALAVL
jgi:hypothetical protein